MSVCIYQHIVDRAKVEYLDNEKLHIDCFIEKCSTIEDAIHYACDSKFPKIRNGKICEDELLCHGHQRRIIKGALK